MTRDLHRPKTVHTGWATTTAVALATFVLLATAVFVSQPSADAAAESNCVTWANRPTGMIPVGAATGDERDRRTLGARTTDPNVNWPADPGSSWSSEWAQVGPGSTAYWTTASATIRNIAPSGQPAELCNYAFRQTAQQAEEKAQQLGLPWVGAIDEEDVFFGALTHNGTDDHRDWQIRVGQGSQIYSIITPHGEAIGSQSVGCGHYWNDSVLQQTFRPTVNRPDKIRLGHYCNAEEDGTRVELYNKNEDVHQAGSYATDGRRSSFFSPILWSQATDDAISTVAWPQPAHFPNNFTSEVVLDQEIVDEGAGVARVTTVAHNFGRDIEETKIWSAFNARLFNTIYSSNAQGDRVDCGPTRVAVQSDPVDDDADAILTPAGCIPDFGDARCANGRYPKPNTDPVEWGNTKKRCAFGQTDLLNTEDGFGGYIILGRQGIANEQDWGMAIVLGNDLSSLKVGPSAGRTVTMAATFAPDNDNGLVGPVNEPGPDNPTIPAGESYEFTYSLIFGPLDTLADSARARVADQVGRVVPGSALDNQDLVMPYCSAMARGVGYENGNNRCRKSRDVRALTFTEPITFAGQTAQPIFVIHDDSSGDLRKVVTTDPYATGTLTGDVISQTADGSDWRLPEVGIESQRATLPVLRPYADGISYQNFAGYGFTEPDEDGCLVALDGSGRVWGLRTDWHRDANCNTNLIQPD